MTLQKVRPSYGSLQVVLGMRTTLNMYYNAQNIYKHIYLYCNTQWYWNVLAISIFNNEDEQHTLDLIKTRTIVRR